MLPILSCFSYSISYSFAQSDPFLHNISLLFLKHGPPSGEEKPAMWPRIWVTTRRERKKKGEDAKRMKKKKYLHLIRFVVIPNELQNPKYGRSASGTEKPILISVNNLSVVEVICWRSFTFFDGLPLRAASWHCLVDCSRGWVSGNTKRTQQPGMVLTDWWNTTAALSWSSAVAWPGISWFLELKPRLFDRVWVLLITVFTGYGSYYHRRVLCFVLNFLFPGIFSWRRKC